MNAIPTGSELIRAAIEGTKKILLEADRIPANPPLYLTEPGIAQMMRVSGKTREEILDAARRVAGGTEPVILKPFPTK